MKKVFISLIAAISCVGLFSQIQGYALYHGQISDAPAVDIYVYAAQNEQDAVNLHKGYAKALGIPDNVVNILDKVRGVTAPAAKVLGSATEGISVMVQEGLDVSAEVMRKANEALKKPLDNAIGRAYRSKKHALHENVAKGNKGNGAGWNTDKRMYAIVTLPNSLIPLNEVPEVVPAHRKVGFIVAKEADPEDSSKVIYEARFSDYYLK